SILAKVTRDRAMVAFSETYPEYAFEKHKGYGTALHVSKIKAHGYCDIHRRSFRLKALEATLFD
ncbi:MAG: ribonuclease HII, partial [Campylobacterota bacterium]|nr:ribonuclease HII [Campylobacterota bacterium]